MQFLYNMMTVEQVGIVQRLCRVAISFAVVEDARE